MRKQLRKWRNCGVPPKDKFNKIKSDQHICNGANLIALCRHCTHVLVIGMGIPRPGTHSELCKNSCIVLFRNAAPQNARYGYNKDDGEEDYPGGQWTQVVNQIQILFGHVGLWTSKMETRCFLSTATLIKLAYASLVPPRELITLKAETKVVKFVTETQFGAKLKEAFWLFARRTHRIVSASSVWEKAQRAAAMQNVSSMSHSGCGQCWLAAALFCCCSKLLLERIGSDRRRTNRSLCGGGSFFSGTRKSKEDVLER
jgi:hypothetical protein